MCVCVTEQSCQLLKLYNISHRMKGYGPLVEKLKYVETNVFQCPFSTIDLEPGPLL